MADKVKNIFAFDNSSNRILLAKKNIKINKKFNIKIVRKKVTELNSIFKKYKIKQCNLLKVDCEGCEYKIFNNTSTQTLNKIKRIVMEIHLFSPKMNQQFANLKNCLSKKDFP